MSKENEKTVEVYKANANIYLETSIKHDTIDPDKAIHKREKLQKFIKKNMEQLPKGVKVFEIGSGDGVNAKYIEKLGYEITASDIAEAFINEIKSKNVRTIKFNVLEDEFIEKYFAIFCWRVFVHFTKEDAIKVLQKVYDTLENDGLFIFNAINREVKDIDEEWVDFPNEYHMGVEHNNKWLVYVLKK